VLASLRNLSLSTKIHAVRGDITRLAVDAVVNAANSSLLGGGGVDGAIHYAAGPSLLAEFRQLGECPTGEARITAGFNLPSPWIIHTVGPVWKGGDRGEATLLASCYIHSLRLAVERGFRSIAFPAISTGAYAYPLKAAASIAIATVQEMTRQNTTLEEVIFCCYSGEDFAVYKKLLGTSPDRHSVS